MSAARCIMDAMLSRILASLVVAAALLGPVQPAHADPADPTRILIIGDSVTNGSVGDYTWRYRLWHNLTGPGAADVDFVGPNTGVLGPDDDGEGDTVNAMEYADPDFDFDHAARWGMSLAFPDHPPAELVEDYAADVVVIDLGLNDLTWLQGAPDVVAGIEERWVGEMRAVNPAVSVVLAQLPQTWMGPKIGEFNGLLEEVAAELDTPGSRVVVASAPTPFVEGVDTWDLGHPSATGEVKIAESVAGALAEVGVGSAPGVFPEVVNGPVDAPVLVPVERHGVVSGLSWSDALGATGVEWWRRDVTAGGGWVEVRAPARVVARPGRVVEWRVRAFKGSAVSPLFSNVVTVSRPGRGR